MQLPARVVLRMASPVRDARQPDRVWVGSILYGYTVAADFAGTWDIWEFGLLL
jgi:hypothetical protein